jgi:hypothetical protein
MNYDLLYSTVLIAIIVIAIAWIYATKPKIIHPIVIRGIIKLVKELEPQIVLAVYSLIPEKAKKEFGSQKIAKVVEYVVIAIVTELEDFANSYNSKSAK